MSLSGSPCRTLESVLGCRLESGPGYERKTVPMSNSAGPTHLPLLHSSPDTLPGSSLLHMRQPLPFHHDTAAADIPHHYTHYTGARLAGSKRPGVLHSARVVG